MRPYAHSRFTDSPDLADIGAEARKSSVGSFRKRGGDYKIGQRSEKKKVTRRMLKRADKGRTPFDTRALLASEDWN